MPELPEVEVTRRGLLPHLPGREVVRVRWGNKRLRRPIPRKLLDTEIRRQRVLTVDRRAKYLLVRMESAAVLLLHLGMTGKIGLFPGETARHRHDHLVLELDNGMEMRFNDARRFGMITVWPAETAREDERRFGETQGIEPFSGAFNGANLHALARGRRVAVKSLLMDSRLIAGIGNIYANETLFAAGIAPDTPAGSLAPEQWEQIAARCREILERAIEAGGSTISDFIGSSGQAGYFQLQLAVYDRKGEPCAACGTPIAKQTLGGRASFFCPVCQP